MGFCYGTWQKLDDVLPRTTQRGYHLLQFLGFEKNEIMLWVFVFFLAEDEGVTVAAEAERLFSKLLRAGGNKGVLPVDGLEVDCPAVFSLTPFDDDDVPFLDTTEKKFFIVLGSVVTQARLFGHTGASGSSTNVVPAPPPY